MDHCESTNGYSDYNYEREYLSAFDFIRAVLQLCCCYCHIILVLLPPDFHLVSRHFLRDGEKTIIGVHSNSFVIFEQIEAAFSGPRNQLIPSSSL